MSSLLASPWGRDHRLVNLVATSGAASRLGYECTPCAPHALQEIDVILTSYVGDADLYVLVGATADQQASPSLSNYKSERSSGADGVAIRYTDTQFVSSACYSAPECRISIGVYVSASSQPLIDGRACTRMSLPDTPSVGLHGRHVHPRRDV